MGAEESKDASDASEVSENRTSTDRETKRDDQAMDVSKDDDSDANGSDEAAGQHDAPDAQVDDARGAGGAFEEKKSEPPNANVQEAVPGRPEERTSERDAAAVLQTPPPAPNSPDAGQNEPIGNAGGAMEAQLTRGQDSESGEDHREQADGSKEDMVEAFESYEGYPSVEERVRELLKQIESEEVEIEEGRRHLDRLIAEGRRMQRGDAGQEGLSARAREVFREIRERDGNVETLEHQLRLLGFQRRRSFARAGEQRRRRRQRRERPALKENERREPRGTKLDDGKDGGMAVAGARNEAKDPVIRRPGDAQQEMPTDLDDGFPTLRDTIYDAATQNHAEETSTNSGAQFGAMSSLLSSQAEQALSESGRSSESSA
mmetsp:Transcript_13792/g.51451  ORF Transcript_13792/g.51451 Transcript_13792/m.51451 type:complete len:375 (-) Transcript_13792:885-2009(-)|eukprot:scaffold278_cov362-Pinguiococcus_pyrenoidosus.AAC.4